MTVYRSLIASFSFREQERDGEAQTPVQIAQRADRLDHRVEAMPQAGGLRWQNG